MTEATEKPMIVVIGDSHTGAIRSAQEKRIKFQRDDDSVEIQIRRRLKIKNGVEIGASPEEISALVSRCRTGDIIALSPEGNTHSKLSIIKHSSPFEYYIPGKNEILENKEIISFGAIYDYFMEHLKREFSLYEAIREIWHGPLYRLCPPPPFRSNEYIAANADSFFRKKGALVGNINDPFFRLKSWKVEVMAIRKECEVNNLHLLMPPANCLDAEGFLAERAYGPDATHANSIYGDYVLQQLIALLPGRSDATIPQISGANR